MLYHIFYSQADTFAAFNIFRYITLRSFIAFLIAALITVIFGKAFINFMKKMQFGQVVRTDGPQSHFKKAGTPTMGGVLIIGSVVITILICGNFASIPLLVTLGVTASFFTLGFLDDYMKVSKKNSKGVSAKGKMLWQILTAAIAGYILLHFQVIDTQLYIPFLKQPVVDLGKFYLLFIIFVIVGSSNAVNLTDGLDGLAVGPIITSSLSLGIIAYVTGHFELSQYLYIPYVSNVGEILVLTAAIIGAGVGFLWFNTYPAQVFMGDVGSLSLGGTLGVIAVTTKSEFLFAIIGGVFVAEALSVIIQVSSFKATKKRVFKMAPIHHHFELLGWPEPKVIVRFWIVSLCLAILALSTLKIR